MRYLSSLAAGLALAVLATPGFAEGPRVYAYESAVNYCPAGLQPVSLNGVICCGQPNQAQSYQQVMAHPVRKKIRHYSPRARSARAHLNCPAGAKGCY
ncbi:hypothetical protein SAMN04487859_10559 [Roseovarius lutimaris]|uniref:Uncharacterized protein n=1 Tax=Roseovarius lutimaris TaxID=1005928 RepID=A0A1I5A4U9_9RHOB|nr:hypothetical protein [Roseovarius lutimaris]SFN57436.1 hypothetical protein SAMN04487859_10559 [Roseovarius lutimaris]